MTICCHISVSAVEVNCREFLGLVPNFNVNSLNQFFLQVKKLLSDGGGVEERYMSETITHAIADDCEADDYSEAKELFELTVVTVSMILFWDFTGVAFTSTLKFNTVLVVLKLALISGDILCVYVCVATDTVVNLDAEAKVDGTCEQTFKVSLQFPSYSCSSLLYGTCFCFSESMGAHVLKMWSLTTVSFQKCMELITPHFRLQF